MQKPPSRVSRHALRWRDPTPHGVGLVPGTPRLTALGLDEDLSVKADRP
jgi:hypothetical protein